MTEPIPQFGTLPTGYYINRPSAYAVVRHTNGRILAVRVRGEYHLPGGGIETGELPEDAVRREVREETGVEISELEWIGQANQYYRDVNINKLGMMYRARFVSEHPEASVEDHHIPVWLTPTEFRAADASEFYKWAVERMGDVL